MVIVEQRIAQDDIIVTLQSSKHTTYIKVKARVKSKPGNKLDKRSIARRSIHMFCRGLQHPANGHDSKRVVNKTIRPN